MNERLTIIEKKSTLKDNSPIIRITIDLIRLECHEHYANVIVFFNQPAFSCQVIHVTFRSQGFRS